MSTAKKADTSPFSGIIVKRGPLSLSILASSKHSSHPQVDGLEEQEYTHVEARLTSDGKPVRPSEVIGLEAYDVYWSEGVAPFLAAGLANQLRAAFSELQASEV